MGKRVVEGPEPYEMDEETESRVDAKIAQAERDIEEMRVNMRWRKAQLNLVKRAAAFLGMPYQTYVKQAAFRQAMADLRVGKQTRENP